MRRTCPPFQKALLICLSMLVLWYLLEYLQFGELQHGRLCDDVIFLAWSGVTYVLCLSEYKKEER